MRPVSFDYSILFVCLGNICRSPAAEAVMASILKRRGLSERVLIDSAGTADYHVGRKSDERMIVAGTRRGYEFLHRARQVAPVDLNQFDLVLAMDSSNLRCIRNLTNDQNLRQKVELFLHRCGFADHMDVPDPYYGDLEGFEQVIDLLEEACERLADDIAEILGESSGRATLA